MLQYTTAIYKTLKGTKVRRFSNQKLCEKGKINYTKLTDQRIVQNELICQILCDMFTTHLI